MGKENIKSKINIAFFGYSHLGDCIEITPFLKNLKSQGAQITYVTSDNLGRHQLINTPYIDDLIIFGKNFREKICSYIRIFFGSFDYVVFEFSYLRAPFWYLYLLFIMTLTAKHITYFSGKLDSKKAKCFDKIIDCNNKPLGIVYKEIARYIYGSGIKYDNNLEIFINRKDEIPYIDELLGKHNCNGNKQYKIIGIFLSGGDVRYTTSGKINRERVKEKRIEIIRYLCAKGYFVVLIGGKDNVNLAKSIIDQINNKNLIDCTGILSIQQSSALISKVDLFICTDSGPLHIAIGFKKKIIALINKFSNFVGYISNPIYSDNIPSIDVSDVIKEMDKIKI